MLSPTESRIFNFIQGYIASNRESPTIAEIQRQFQMRSPASVHAHLSSLVDKGLLKRTPNVSRGIQLAEQSVNAS